MKLCAAWEQIYALRYPYLRDNGLAFTATLEMWNEIKVHCRVKSNQNQTSSLQVIAKFYRSALNENAVKRWEFCLSVRLSVKCVDCDKTKKTVQIFIRYERSFSLIFWEKEWLVGATLSTWNFGSTDPRWSEITDFEPIIARSASAVTPSKKSSINTNRKSRASNERKMIIVRCR